MRDPSQCFESATDSTCPGHYALYVRNAEDAVRTSASAWRVVPAPAPVQFVTITGHGYLWARTQTHRSMLGGSDGFPEVGGTAARVTGTDSLSLLDYQAAGAPLSCQFLYLKKEVLYQRRKVESSDWQLGSLSDHPAPDDPVDPSLPDGAKAPFTGTWKRSSGAYSHDLCSAPRGSHGVEARPIFADRRYVFFAGYNAPDYLWGSGYDTYPNSFIAVRSIDGAGSWRALWGATHKDSHDRDFVLAAPMECPACAGTCERDAAIGSWTMPNKDAAMNDTRVVEYATSADNINLAWSQPNPTHDSRVVWGSGYSCRAQQQSVGRIYVDGPYETVPPGDRTEIFLNSPCVSNALLVQDEACLTQCASAPWDNWRNNPLSNYTSYESLGRASNCSIASGAAVALVCTSGALVFVDGVTQCGNSDHFTQPSMCSDETCGGPRHVNNATDLLGCQA